MRDRTEALDRDVAELLERSEQLTELDARLAAVLARGSGQIVLVRGESGIGKDEATLDVVRLVAGRVEAAPVLLIVSYRDEALHRSHPLRIVVGELPRAPSIARLLLGPLSRAAVARLAERSAIDADQLFAWTAGNPFFVTEALAAEGAGVPATVRDAVLARAARLSAQANTVLDSLSIVPQRCELWLLEALAGDALGALDECLRSGIVTSEAGGIAFRHEIARLAIEESIAPDRTVALHRSALSTLAEPPLGAPEPARLAHHAESAADAEAVLRFAPAAAEQAASFGARREAESQYARALRFADGTDPVLHADLLERFANECYFTHMGEPGLAALDAALAIHVDRGDAAKQGQLQQLRARTLSLHADDFERTLTWGLRASELAERVGDTESLVLALTSIGAIELARGMLDGRSKLLRSLALAKEADLPAEAGRAYINLLAGVARNHLLLQSDELIGAGVEYCREHGLDAYLGHLTCARAEAHLIAGRWDEAAATAMTILDRSSSAPTSQRFMARMVLALVRARRGDPGEWPLLDELSAAAEASGELQFLAPTAAARAEAAWLEGRADAIAEETNAAFALAIELADPGSMGELASWRWRGGALTAAPAEVQDVHRLQITGEWERAARYWTEHGYRYEAALALADSDDVGALRRALDDLRDLGARPAAAIVARRLRALGERGVPRGPRARTRTNPVGLKARELEVLPLIAAGLRNAQIAQRLVVSNKTVDHHVSSILRKLDVRTRDEAGAKAGRLGLLGTEENRLRD